MFSGPIGHKGYLYWPDGSREKATGLALCGLCNELVHYAASDTCPPIYRAEVEGRTVYLCKSCVAKMEVAALKQVATIAAYDYVDTVKTWGGTVLGRVTSRAVFPHNMARRMVALRVRDVHGQLWHGRHSDSFDLVNLRRCAT